nr:phage antirepressor N-terminal domain-containing protein [uncultured Albidiferax sp.]
MNSNTQHPATAIGKSEPVQLMPVLFHEDTLVLVEHNAQPYVVMKPLVTAMGLDWRSQYVKLAEKFGSTMVEITTVAEDGKPRTMICQPLRKLPGWLYSLNPGKLTAALRPKVIRYQDECDEVLWRHWTQQEPLHGGKRLGASDSDRLMRRRGDLRKELGNTASLGVATDAYADYVLVSALLGQRASAMLDLAPGVRQQILALEGGAP